MKKVQFLLAGFSILLLILWLSKQRASSVDSVGVANEYLLKGKYSEAISLYQRLAEKENDKDRLAARSGVLRALLITGQYEKLEALAGEYLQLSPNETSFRLFLGKSYSLRGKYPEAQQEFEKALKSSPSTRNEAQLNLGLLHQTLGRLPESRAQFSEVYERIAGEGNSHLGLAAIALQNLGRFHEANKLFKQATRQDPNDLDTWNAWGNLFLEKYNPAEAATVFADALKINPNHPESLLGMALSRYEGQGEQEEEVLRKALEINPNLEGAHAALAEAALESDAFDQAAGEIENCLRINPRSLKACSLKATLSYAKGQQNGVQDEVQEVLRINPLYGEIYEKLADYCVTQRLYKEAVEFFRKAIEINPRLWTAYSGLGINLLRTGDEQAAKDALETAYKNDRFNVWTVNSLRLIDSYKNFDSVRTMNFELKLHKKESKLLQNYVPQLLEEAYQTLSLKYQYYPNRPIYFEMFPDHEDFAVRTLGVPGLGALGVCFGRGVVMDSPSARPQGNFNWGSTLWHEFAHVVTLGITNHRVPRWFTEGLSVMEEHKAKPGWGEGLNLETVRAMQEKKLLPIAELNSGFIRPKFPGQVQLSYFQAGQACEFIEKEFGFEKILEMLTLFKSGQSLERTLQAGINLSPQEFDQKFNAYLESLYGKTLRAVDFKTLEDKDLMQDPKKLETLLAGRPDNFFANLKLAGYYRKEGNLEKAITFFNVAKSVFPFYVDSDNPYKQLSEIYKQQGRLKEAISELQALTKRNDSDFESMKQLAQWLNETHRQEEASSVLQKALFVQPFDPETHELLADISLKQKGLDLALREYQALLALDPPDKATAHFNVARVLLQMGKRPEAKKEALAALEIAPGFEPAQELLLKAIEVN